VLYDNSRHAWWDSHTQGHPGAQLNIQDDGNAVIYDASSRPIWATNTFVPAAFTFNSPQLTSDRPLQGSIKVNLFRTGAVNFECFAHDSGFDNIDYTISALLLAPEPMTPQLHVYSLSRQGGVEGTSAGLPLGTPRRDDHYTEPDFNKPEIAANWEEIVRQGVLRAQIEGTDALLGGIEGMLGDMAKAAAEEFGKDLGDLIYTKLIGPLPSTAPPGT
jgi:hypothetical protein